MARKCRSAPRRIHYDEVTLLGSFHYTPADVREAYRLLAEGELKLGGLITGERPLSELPQAFEELSAAKASDSRCRPEAFNDDDGPVASRIFSCQKKCGSRCCEAPTS